LPALRARLQEVGLHAFYADAAAVAKLDPAEREQRLRAWEAEAREPDASGEASASG
jgi:hypothetical protein